jgi:hypothetical protein
MNQPLVVQSPQSEARSESLGHRSPESRNDWSSPHCGTGTTSCDGVTAPLLTVSQAVSGEDFAGACHQPRSAVRTRACRFPLEPCGAGGRWMASASSNGIPARGLQPCDHLRAPCQFAGRTTDRRSTSNSKVDAGRCRIDTDALEVADRHGDSVLSTRLVSTGAKALTVRCLVRGSRCPDRCRYMQPLSVRSVCPAGPARPAP